MPPKLRDVIAELEADGWRQTSQRGSHRQFEHPQRLLPGEGPRALRQLGILVLLVERPDVGLLEKVVHVAGAGPFAYPADRRNV